MPNRAFETERAGLVRWLTVGVPCYLGWLLANLFLGVLFPLLLLIELAGGPAGLSFLRWFGAGFLRFFFLRYFQLIHVYRARDLPDPNSVAALGPCVFVANHRSWIDPLLLIALLPNVRIPVNTSYTKVPLVGRMMHWLGCVPLDRNSRESIAFGLGTVREDLKDNIPVAVFPEGTRSEVGHLRQFSDFFFRVAIEADVPVVPLLIHISHPFLGPEENYLTARPAVLTIRLLDKIEPKKGDRSADLRRIAQKQIAKELAKLDTGEAKLKGEKI